MDRTLASGAEEEFPSSPYGIAQPQLLDVPPELAIQKPRSLLALEEVTRYAPTGSMLVRHLHHYGAVQTRRVEYMLMGNYPDPEVLKQSQQVLRMSQFNDERKKLQQANPWRITGNTLDLFVRNVCKMINSRVMPRFLKEADSIRSP